MPFENHCHPSHNLLHSNHLHCIAMDDNTDIQLKKIPAFTVLKNGSILKNIFLLHKPPPFDSSSIHQESEEEILLVGRHPQCNITLEHPSISRYHLRIHSNPSSQMLSIIDLSSVHGTWVSGKRIESGVPVKLKEGDTLRMGGSSRIYELHWVPQRQAYDVDDPFIPAVYAFKEETKQDENCLCLSDDDLESLKVQKLNPLTSPYCSNSCSDDTEVEHSSSPSNGNGEIFRNSLVQPSPFLLETMSAIEDFDSQNELENQANDKTSDEFEQLSNGTIREDPFSVANCSSSSCDDMEVEHSSFTGNESGEIFATFSDQAPPVVSETISATEISDDNLKKSEDESSMKDDLVSVAFFDAIMHGKDALDQDIARGNENQQKVENSPVPVALFNGVKRDDNGVFMPLRAESVEVSAGCDFEQMNQTKTMDESASIDMGVELELFDQETTKKDSVLVAFPDGVHIDQERTFTPDKSRTIEVYINPEAMHNVSVPVNLFDSLDGNELEIFTPDKENNHPNSLKSLKRRWKEDEHEQSHHCTMSKKAVNPADVEKNLFGFSKNLFATDGEKFVSDTLLQRSPDKITKMEGSYNSIDYPQTVQKVIDSSHNIMGVAKKRWTIVVDTYSLLHNESLKHLKLLQGLIGTQLFVPKIVIRELMDIKGQDDILKKSTKKVSLALKWIDECMIDTKWWIRVDDSSEAEPEVLETALHLRKEITDRKIIVLSNDLTLKIKAMAEGVMCEEAEEFRRSLVNPFSERFMWVGSSARGLTWSCVDDDVLRQKYHGCIVNASHRLKGLKLLANITNFR